MSFVNAQNNSFWYINVGNYLNTLEATEELNRFEILGFQGKLVTISENDISLNQLRIGCFLNESTASTHLAQLSHHLRYPSLSSLVMGEIAMTSYCLGYETGIVLPNNWQIIRDDNIFLVSVNLLDYERVIGFNGLTWQSFQNEASISEAWLTSIATSEPKSEFICQNTTSRILQCMIDEKLVTDGIEGQLIWQNRHAAIYQINNTLEVIQVQSF